MTNRVIGDLDFGPEASIDYNALRLRWFDYHVKGIENGIGEDPPIKIFVMGANTWRYENEFPLARTVYTDYFLRSGPSGSINSLNDGLLSSEPPDSYEYDPMKPLSAIGGDLHVQPMGARDHRPVDRLSLTYTTPPLEEDLEVTGWPVLEFYASSSAVDTDWVVTPQRRAPRRLFTAPETEPAPGKVQGGVREAGPHDAGPAAPVQDRDVSHRQRVQGGAPDPDRHPEQQLSQVVPQPEHRQGAL